MHKPFILFTFCLFLMGCSDFPSIKTTHYEEICGRDNGQIPFARAPIFRAQVPEGWIREDLPPQESNSDTTKSLCEFFIPGEHSEKIRITIHNFPTESTESRIPPNAQIARWKRQFTSLDSASVHITAQSYSGFSGFLLEATGQMNNQDTAINAWAMQLAPEHYSALGIALSNAKDPIDLYTKQQMRSDFTIKATGPTILFKAYSPSIFQFARSFELIQDIPSSP